MYFREDDNDLPDIARCNLELLLWRIQLAAGLWRCADTTPFLMHLAKRFPRNPLQGSALEILEITSSPAPCLPANLITGHQQLSLQTLSFDPLPLQNFAIAPLTSLQSARSPARTAISTNFILRSGPPSASRRLNQLTPCLLP